VSKQGKAVANNSNNTGSCYCSLTLKPCLHHTTCCQTGCQTSLTNGCIVYAVKPFDNWLYCVYHNKAVVKPVVQPVW